MKKSRVMAINIVRLHHYVPIHTKFFLVDFFCLFLINIDTRFALTERIFTSSNRFYPVDMRIFGTVLGEKGKTIDLGQRAPLYIGEGGNLDNWCDDVKSESEMLC